MIFRQIIILLLLSFAISSHAQSNFFLDAPSGEIRVTIKIGDSLYCSVNRGGIPVLQEAAIALITTDSKLGVQSKVKNRKRRAVRDTIINSVPFKRKEIPDHLNEVTL